MSDAVAQSNESTNETNNKPKARKVRGVLLNLPPEVIDFFRTGEKGHITRMQKVLAEYVSKNSKPGNESVEGQQ